MSNKENLITITKSTQETIRKIIDDISENDSMHQMYDEMNHLKWQIGHLFCSTYYTEKALGGTTEPNSNYEKLFGYGSKISKQSSDYPDLNSLRTDLYDQWDKINALLEKTTEEDLDKEIEFAENWKNAACIGIHNLLMHDYYHMGQVVQTIRSLGKKGPFG